MSEQNEMYRGLAVDLITCLEKRNAELVEARHTISGLIVAMSVEAADKDRALIRGRQWLANYNDRMYPKTPPSTTGKGEE